MTHPPADEHRFHTEVLKLLLQVITSDEKVAPEEIEELSFVAERWKVPASEVSRIGGIEAMMRVRAGAEVPRRRADRGRPSRAPSGWTGRAAP